MREEVLEVFESDDIAEDLKKKLPADHEFNTVLNDAEKNDFVAWIKEVGIDKINKKLTLFIEKVKFRNRILKCIDVDDNEFTKLFKLLKIEPQITAKKDILNIINKSTLLNLFENLMEYFNTRIKSKPPRRPKRPTRTHIVMKKEAVFLDIPDRVFFHSTSKNTKDLKLQGVSTEGLRQFTSLEGQKLLGSLG